MYFLEGPSLLSNFLDTMFGFIALILAIILFIKVDKITKKLEKLEQEERVLRKEGEIFTSHENIPHQEAKDENWKEEALDRGSVALAGTYKERVQEEVSLEEEDEGNQKEYIGALKNQIHIFQGNWMVKVGIVLLVLSVAWLVTYAFSNDIIGSTGRVFLGIVFGIALFIWGTKWYERSSIQGIFILSGGALSIYIALFAGTTLYNFYGPEVALFVMSVVCVYFALLSILKKEKKIAFALLFFGLVAPLFVISSLENHNAIFVYLFILSCGVIGVDYFLKWRGTTVFALLGVLIYSILLGSFIFMTETTLTHFIFVVLFVLLFYITSLWFIITSQKIASYDLILITLLGFSYFAWMSLFIPEEMFGIALVFGALIFSISAYGAFVFTSVREPVLLYGGVSLGLLLGATADFLSGPALTLILLMELAIVLIFHFIFIKGKFIKTRVVFFFLLLWPIFLSFESFEYLYDSIEESRYDYDYREGVPYSLEDSQYYYDSVETEIVYLAENDNTFVHFFILGMFAFIFSLLSWIVWKYNTYEKEINEKIGLYAMVIATLGYSMAFIWFLLHILTSSYYVGSMLSLIVFSLIGAFLYVWGSFSSKIMASQLGITLIVLVLLRLFLVEFWDMEMLWKIITFFVVGSILVGTAVLFNRGKKGV
jgi:hypothetical protein